MRLAAVLVIGALSGVTSVACGSSEDDDAGGTAGTGGTGGSAGTAGSGGASGSAGAAGSAGSSGGCPLSAEAKALLEELTQKQTLDALFVAGESHASPPRIALAQSLLGTTNGMLASFTPIETCTAGVAKWYEPYCSDAEPGGDEFWQTRASCSRWGCDAAGNTLVEVWYTVRPQQTLEPRHAFSYPFQAAVGSALTGRTGSVDWTQNPFSQWTRTDNTDGSLQVTASAEHALKVELDGGVSVDLSHTVQVEFTNDAQGELQTLVVGIAFSAIAGSEIISAAVELTDPVTHELSGSVALNGFDIIAKLTPAQGEEPPKWAWEGICAP